MNTAQNCLKLSYVIFLSFPSPFLPSLSLSAGRFSTFFFFLLVFLMSSVSLTIEPGRQVFALHAIVLLAQVPQNDWLCTQEVVKRC